MKSIRCVFGCHDFDVVFSKPREFIKGVVFRRGPLEDLTCVRCGVHMHQHEHYDNDPINYRLGLGHKWNDGPSAFDSLLVAPIPPKGWDSWILSTDNNLQRGCKKCGCWYPAQPILSRALKDVPQPPCPKCGE